MPDFRIYYDGGLTYEGAPENAPAFGVLVIVEKDQIGRLVDDEYWYSVVKRANEDPDFPARTSYGYNERVV